jgi:hypothetical protein
VKANQGAAGVDEESLAALVPFRVTQSPFCIYATF